ncbi:MAG: tRNA (adenosine(37)-N6)-dimethylallyltransferase MiaA [Phycisphaeraceae bacterium]|nr:tRNA (adenosine(37)-N6)-dimethylallyltransferase MiaA [Phycisphaeraceae bacterium]
MVRPLVILGPTAGGKSDLAYQLAQRLSESDAAPPQIISADSMQIYRHMDAGTAKPSPEVRQRVRHHLIDAIEPTEPFTVAQWLERTEQVIGDLLERGIRPIVTGGTHFYLRALLEGFFEGPGSDSALRKELSDLSNDDLAARLAAIDSRAAARIHPNDRRRLIRALEVFELTGQPISELQTQWTDAQADEVTDTVPYRHNPLLVGLRWSSTSINRRINRRVGLMFQPPAAQEWPPESLPAETRRLEALGLLGRQAREALGYKQVLDALAGQSTMEDAFERTKIQTRRFAKQQRTWLKRFEYVGWIDADRMDEAAWPERIWNWLREVEAGSRPDPPRAGENLSP